MMHLGIDVGGRSVKIAALVGGQIVWTAQSSTYTNPTPRGLAEVIWRAVAGRCVDLSGVGLCVPGILNADQTRIELAVNLPLLNNVPLDQIVADALGRFAPNLRVLNDATATGYDLYLGRKLSDRLFLLVMGTGVGVCVMDASGPLRVDGESPGHFGQLDISLEGLPVVGPDGGAGCLEGYIGGPVLNARYGTEPGALEKIQIGDPAGRALVRALRIAHAMYRPQHFLLAGGVGIRLGGLIPDLLVAVNKDLTSIARPGWTLGVGETDFHAAAGAARAAALT